MNLHSDDPDVAHAAGEAQKLINEVLSKLPEASQFDYGGHVLQIGEYDVCQRCTKAIAEAQQAKNALQELYDSNVDETIKEHIQQAVELMAHEAQIAEIRARLHNGHNTEPILNTLLGYIHDKNIHDQFDHSHLQEN